MKVVTEACEVNHNLDDVDSQQDGVSVDGNGWAHCC